MLGIKPKALIMLMQALYHRVISLALFIFWNQESNLSLLTWKNTSYIKDENQASEQCIAYDPI